MYAPVDCPAKHGLENGDEMMPTYLSIVLPVYNEEARLHRCLERLTAYLWNYTHYKFEILCVLNGCTDASAGIAWRFASLWPQIRIKELQERGKGGAVKAGMLAASGKYRMMADVDLATPPQEFGRFVQEAQKGADLVTGVRKMHYANPLRYVTHIGYRLLARRLTWVRDPQCGFKLFTAVCADDVFSHCTTTGWGFDVEVLHLAGDGYKIKELEVPWRNGEGSKLNPLTDGIKMARDLMHIRKIYSPSL
jgi:dolichyl-phosphate beta-glucosyltransferase